MYYVQVIGNNTDYSGSVGSHAAYQISPGQDMEFKSTNGNKQMHLYANVTDLPNYMLCVQYPASLNPNISIYASNSHYSPYWNDASSYEYVSNVTYENGKNKRVCVQGQNVGHTFAYFSVRTDAVIAN